MQVKFSYAHEDVAYLNVTRNKIAYDIRWKSQYNLKIYSTSHKYQQRGDEGVEGV